MTADLSSTVFPLPAPKSAFFDLGLAAQSDDGARLAYAVATAEQSRHPATKAAAIFYVQLHFIRLAAPDADLSDIHTIEDAQQLFDHIRATDPDACDRLRNLLKG